VHFAHDNLDLRSRGGRLAADIQAVVAADYVRNLRDELRKGMRGRLKQGLYPWRAPVGYLDQGGAKPKAVDPMKGPIVRSAFELYATKSYSYETLAAELSRRGLRRPNGQPLSLNGMTTLLRNPFYAGLIRLKQTGELFQGIHEPLISANLFEQVQDIIDGRDNSKVQRLDFLYRHLVRCGACGYVLTGEQQKGHVYYRCHTRGCSTTGIREDRVSECFRGALGSLSFIVSHFEEMNPYLMQDDDDYEVKHEARIAGQKLRLSKLADRERRLTDAYLEQVIDSEEYAARKSDLLLERSQAKDELARLADEGAANPALSLEEFFEPLKAFEWGPRPDSWGVYRQAIEKLTSNRTLSGKKLDIAMRSPFQEAARDLALPDGEPQRDELRTCTAQSLTSGNSVAPPTPEQLASIILPHLKAWMATHPRPREPKKRKPLPHAFKQKPPPANDNTGDVSKAA
jgi:site-specific DNA recombinase